MHCKKNFKNAIYKKLSQMGQRVGKSWNHSWCCLVFGAFLGIWLISFPLVLGPCACWKGKKKQPWRRQMDDVCTNGGEGLQPQICGWKWEGKTVVRCATIRWLLRGGAGQMKKIIIIISIYLIQTPPPPGNLKGCKTLTIFSCTPLTGKCNGFFNPINELVG